MLVEDGGQHTVVGRDELVVAGFGRDAPTHRSDAGIDDDEKDCPGWKILVRRGELQRGAQHVVRRQIVGDVNERRVRTNPERDAFHRAGVVVLRAEVGQERDDGPRHATSLLRGLAEEDLSEVVLQQERIGDAKAGEQRLRVATSRTHHRARAVP